MIILIEVNRHPQYDQPDPNNRRPPSHSGPTKPHSPLTDRKSHPIFNTPTPSAWPGNGMFPGIKKAQPVYQNPSPRPDPPSHENVCQIREISHGNVSEMRVVIHEALLLNDTQTYLNAK